MTDLPKSKGERGRRRGVLITGVGGYLGSHVALQLLQLGYKVKGTVRNPDNKKSWAHLDHLRTLLNLDESYLQVVRGDLLKDTPEHWDSVLCGCDLVMHTASPFMMAGKESELVSAATRGTEMVLRAVGRANQAKPGTITKVVLTSSVAAIAMGHDQTRIASGPMTHEDWSVEKNTHGYELSKLKAERLAWDLQKEYGFNMDVINPTLIVGPGLAKHHATVESSNALKSLVTSPVYSNVGMCSCDVRDVAEAHLRAAFIRPNGSGMRYICASPDASNISFKELSELAVKSLPTDSGFQAPTWNCPSLIVRALSYVDANVAGVLGFLDNVFSCDATPAERDLGIKWRPIQEALSDHLKFLMYCGELESRQVAVQDVNKCLIYSGPQELPISEINIDSQ